MAQPGQRADDTLVGWYARRIGEPLNKDEAYGYWLFAFGVIAGVLGLILFFSSAVNFEASATKQIGLTLVGMGLALLIAGPIIRLPLKRPATLLTLVGLVVSLLGLVWFLFAYPVHPVNEAALARQIVSVYAAGLAVMAVGGIVVPMLTEPADRRKSQAARIGDLESEVGSERDRADQAESDAAARTAEVEALRARLDAQMESQARFELFEDNAGKWRWRLRHRNGNVIADGGQGYASKQTAQQGMNSVRRNALGAAVLQLAGADDADEHAADADAVPEMEPESRAQFELFEDSADEWRWRLVHDNGNVIADSGEGYASRQKARQGMDSVRKNVARADYLRIDPTAYEVYRDNAGKWRWRLVHRNGNVLADGGQGYASRQGARKGVESVKRNVADADVDVLEVNS